MVMSHSDGIERLFRAEHRTLVAFCFRRVDDLELAQDLAAEVFRIAWSRRAESRRSDRAWLFGIARNLVGTEYRKRVVRNSSTDRSFRGEDLPDPHSADQAVHVEVRATIAALTPEHAEVLRLTYWDGLSAAEVAEVLGTTAPAVWMRLTRARAAFAAAWRTDHSTTPTPQLRSQP